MDRFACTIQGCTKSFKKQCKLARHLLSHSNERQFVCKECNSLFQRQDHLKRHSKIHNKTTHEYKCPYEDCLSLGFIDNSHLKRHISKMHENPHKCLQCSVKFVKKIMLMKHMTMSHKVPPPFSCETCQKSIYSHGQYEHHMNRHIEASKAKSQNQDCKVILEEIKEVETAKHTPLYRCTELGCLKIYTTKFNLKTHIRTYHKKEKHYKCPFCLEVYMHNVSLKHHIEKEHNSIKQMPILTDSLVASQLQVIPKIIEVANVSVKV